MNPEAIARASEKMIEKGRDTYETRLAAGQARVKLGQFETAIEHLTHATEHKPAQTMAWQELGKALEKTGDLKSAKTAWQTGLEIAQQNGDKQAEKVMTVWLSRLTNAKINS